MPYMPMPPAVAAEVQKAVREKALAEIGQQAVDYAADTGTCLFCARLETVGSHDAKCPVGLFASGAAAPEPPQLTSANRYEEALAIAKEKGCIIVAPKANELFIDLDEEKQFDVFKGQITKVVEVLGKSVSWNRRWLAGRYHIVVTLPVDVTDVERIALQACLGSDLVREILSWARMRLGHDLPTCFFEKAPVDG